MAALKENLLSLGHLTGTERNTFTKQREHSLKKSVNRPTLQSHKHLKEMHLQQHWQELRERELTAQQHNRQLLQQFEEAQDTLREMLSLTAAMKTIRMEYERYLDESSPRWQKELKEKTQAAQKKRMEEYLRSCLKNTEEELTKSSADRALLSQGPTSKPQNVAPPQKHCSQNSHLDYKQDGSPHLPYMQSSWQTNPQSQTARFPIRAPHQPQGSSHVPPSFLPPPIFPDQFQLHHHTSNPGHHHPWARQNPPGWASLQPPYPWTWTAGAAGIPSGSEALWGRFYMEEPPPESGVAQVAGEEAETGRAPSSKREGGGGSRSSHLSQELDIKPVRLSSGHAESGESSMECSQVSTEKRKRREKRGRARPTSSDRERRSSQESSRISSAVVPAAVSVAQSSESDASSEKGRTSTRRTRRSGGLSVGSPGDEKEAKGRTRSNGEDSGSHKEESQSGGEELGSPTEESRGEKAGDQSPDVKSESCNEESGSRREEEEESGSVSIKIENGGGDEIEKQERSSVRDEDEEQHEKDLEDCEGDDGEEKENNQTDDEQEERDVEDDDEASEKKNTTEEEEETGAEEEMEERLKSDGSESGKQSPTSAQDEEGGEDASEGGEDKTEEEEGESDEEEEGEGEEESEQRRDEAGKPEEGSDSEDSIISPQDKSKMMHIIPEAASEEEEEEEGSKTGSSDSDSNEISDEDDVEHLLAPQQQSQKKEVKDLRVEEKPKAFCDKVEILQVEMDKSMKTDNPSDSDEFDHFYD